MIHKLFPAALLLLVACNQTPNNANSEKMNYPQTRMDNTVDTYFGTQIADPYRWLEDDRSAETARRPVCHRNPLPHRARNRGYRRR